MKFKSALLTQVSGSIGGMTGSHNQGGMYMRARSMPTNPNTALQQGIRSLFRNTSQLWGTFLNDAERQSWRDYAQATPVIGKLGDTIALTGSQAFVKANVSRQTMGASVEATAPATGGYAPVQIEDLAVTVGVLNDLTFDIDSEQEDTRYAVYKSPALADGVSSFRGVWRKIADGSSADGTVTIDIASDGFVADNRYALRVIATTVDEARYSIKHDDIVVCGSNA